MAELGEMTKEYLQRQLVRLGDMMGDGLHLERDGKWISREYRQAAIALGLIPARRPRSVARINESVAKAIADTKCACGGELKQARSGDLRAKCLACGKRYQIKTRKAKP